MNIQSTLSNVAESLIKRRQLLAVAESCTGGWLAKLCTDLPGSSAWFECGLVTYSNRAKMELLNVSKQTLDKFGAVSEQTVMEMATGVFLRSPASWSIAISGVAGPDGGSEVNPVGSVWFAWMEKEFPPLTQKMCFSGNRNDIRRQSVEFALVQLSNMLI